jgi:hypothetical protein
MIRAAAPIAKAKNMKAALLIFPRLFLNFFTLGALRKIRLLMGMAGILINPWRAAALQNRPYLL